MWAVKHSQGELVLKVRFLEMPVSRFLKWNRRVSAFCFWCNCFARSMNSYAQMFLIKCRVALFTHYSKAPFAKPQLINSDRVGFTSESLCWQQHSWLLAFVSLMFNSLKLVSILLIIELQCIYGNISKAMVLHQAFLKLVPDLYPNFVNWLNHSLSKQEVKQKVIYLLHKSYTGVLNFSFAIWDQGISISLISKLHWHYRQFRLLTLVLLYITICSLPVPPSHWSQFL